MSDKDIGRLTAVALRASEQMTKRLEALEKLFPEPFMKKRVSPTPPKEQSNGMV